MECTIANLQILNFEVREKKNINIIFAAISQITRLPRCLYERIAGLIERNHSQTLKIQYNFNNTSLITRYTTYDNNAPQ